MEIKHNWQTQQLMHNNLKKEHLGSHNWMLISNVLYLAAISQHHHCLLAHHAITICLASSSPQQTFKSLVMIFGMQPAILLFQPRVLTPTVGACLTCVTIFGCLVELATIVISVVIGGVAFDLELAF